MNIFMNLSAMYWKFHQKNLLISITKAETVLLLLQKSDQKDKKINITPFLFLFVTFKFSSHSSRLKLYAESAIQFAETNVEYSTSNVMTILFSIEKKSASHGEVVCELDLRISLSHNCFLPAVFTTLRAVKSKYGSKTNH